MPKYVEISHNQKIKGIVSLILTLFVIYSVEKSLLILFVLLAVWYFIFRPFSKEERIMFVIASAFIIGQNYSVLKTGGFAFTKQDFLLMPYYEPFLWGFYFLNIKRFVGESPRAAKLGIKSFGGFLLTGICFFLFSKDSHLLFLSTLVSTGVLLFMFHEADDFFYAAYALFLGFIVEIFGVSTGAWSYPDPDFLGIPLWFATMWISVGILGRRFLIPLSEWVTSKLP